MTFREGCEEKREEKKNKHEIYAQQTGSFCMPAQNGVDDVEFLAPSAVNCGGS